MLKEGVRERNVRRRGNDSLELKPIPAGKHQGMEVAVDNGLAGVLDEEVTEPQTSFGAELPMGAFLEGEAGQEAEVPGFVFAFAAHGVPGIPIDVIVLF